MSMPASVWALRELRAHPRVEVEQQVASGPLVVPDVEVGDAAPADRLGEGGRDGGEGGVLLGDGVPVPPRPGGHERTLRQAISTRQRRDRAPGDARLLYLDRMIPTSGHPYSPDTL
jgi:hypothetical protein